VNAQLAVVVILTFCCVLIGVAYPIYMLSARNKYINTPAKLLFGDYINPIFSIFKIASLIGAIATLGGIYRLFLAAGRDDCSDKITNMTFNYLAKNLPQIYYKSFGNLGIELATFMMAVYSIVSNYLDSKRDKIAPLPPPGTDMIVPTVGQVMIPTVAGTAQVVPMVVAPPVAVAPQVAPVVAPPPQMAPVVAAPQVVPSQSAQGQMYQQQGQYAGQGYPMQGQGYPMQQGYVQQQQAYSGQAMYPQGYQVPMQAGYGYQQVTRM